MEKKIIRNKGNLRQMSEYLDRLIKKAVSAGLHDPKIENEIKELNDMLKALDYSSLSCEIGSDNDSSIEPL